MTPGKGVAKIHPTGRRQSRYANGPGSSDVATPGKTWSTSFRGPSIGSRAKKKAFLDLPCQHRTIERIQNYDKLTDPCPLWLRRVFPARFRCGTPSCTTGRVRRNVKIPGDRRLPPRQAVARITGFRGCGLAITRYVAYFHGSTHCWTI